jgi:hypothetical protein
MVNPVGFKSSSSLFTLESQTSFDMTRTSVGSGNVSAPDIAAPKIGSSKIGSPAISSAGIGSAGSGALRSIAPDLGKRSLSAPTLAPVGFASPRVSSSDFGLRDLGSNALGREPLQLASAKSAAGDFAFAPPDSAGFVAPASARLIQPDGSSAMSAPPAGRLMPSSGGDSLLAQAATASGGVFNAPTRDSSNTTAVGNTLLSQIQALAPGASVILATKTAVGLPPALLNWLPPSIRQTIKPELPLVMAWILPVQQLTGAIEAFTAGDNIEGFRQLGEAAANSTLFLGTGVGQSIGPFPNQIAGNTVGQIATIKFNGVGESPTFELRQGVAFSEQNMGPGDPVWLFVNSGPGLTPFTTQDSSADARSVELSSPVQDQLVAAALFRLPGTATASEWLGRLALGFSQGNNLAGPVALADDVPMGFLAQLLMNGEGLYIGPGIQAARVQADFGSGELTLNLAGNNRWGLNVKDVPAFLGDAASQWLAPMMPEAALWADGFEPTRTSFSEIVDTPTNRVLGTETPFVGRLDLYWRNYVDNRDMVSVAYRMVDEFGSANPAQRSNLSNLYWRPEMEPVRLLFQGMFSAGNGMIALPQNLGKDGYFGIDDVGVAIRDLRESLPPDEFQARLRDTAKLLIGAGWEMNFGVPALQQQIEVVKENLARPMSPDPATREIAPLYRPGASLERASIGEPSGASGVA